MLKRNQPNGGEQSKKIRDRRQNAGAWVIVALSVCYGLAVSGYHPAQAQSVAPDLAFAPALFLSPVPAHTGMLDNSELFPQDPKLPRIPTGIPQVPIPDAPKQPSGPILGRFSHTSPGAHAGFARSGSCSSCHSRAGLAATLPGHKSCNDCHNFIQLRQEQPTQYCGVCHAPATSSAVKTVTRARSFNSLFAHVSHARGAGRPAQGCALCHKPTGALQTIPAFTLNTHQLCFSCHTQGSRIGDCSECHKSGGRGGWKGPGGVAFGKGFSHVQHGPRQRLSCDECHTTRPGPAGRQVSSTDAEQHFPGKGQSCASCHNDKPTFGEKDFGDCRKCHKGGSFRL